MQNSCTAAPGKIAGPVHLPAPDPGALKISGSGVNGRINVTDQSVDVDVKLGFALMMLEGTIRTSIEDAMDKHFVGFPPLCACSIRPIRTAESHLRWDRGCRRRGRLSG